MIETFAHASSPPAYHSEFGGGFACLLCINRHSQPNTVGKPVRIVRPRYNLGLTGVTQRSAWKPWILFMLDAIEQTSANTNHLINQIVNQMESTLEYGKKEVKWYGKEVNEVLFSQPYTKPSTIGKTIGRTSRTTLTKYMQELTSKRILTPKQEGKEVYYINNDLVRILEGNN